MSSANDDTMTLPPITFSPADIPPGADETDARETSTSAPGEDLSCETCGTPLQYGGRGRRPRFCNEHKPPRQSRTGTVRGSAADVNAALAQMDVLYSLAGGALMMFRPELASAFAARADLAQQVNKSAFESDRALAKRVAGNAAGMSPIMFIGAQIYVVGPLVRSVYDTSKKTAKPKTGPTVNGQPFSAFSANGDGASA